MYRCSTLFDSTFFGVGVPNLAALPLSWGQEYQYTDVTPTSNNLPSTNRHARVYSDGIVNVWAVLRGHVEVYGGVMHGCFLVALAGIRMFIGRAGCLAFARITW
jgi:hypothetical protein